MAMTERTGLVPHNLLRLSWVRLGNRSLVKSASVKDRKAEHARSEVLGER